VGDHDEARVAEVHLALAVDEEAVEQERRARGLEVLPVKSMKVPAVKRFSLAPPLHGTPAGEGKQTPWSAAAFGISRSHGKWIRVPGGSPGWGGHCARTIGGMGGTTGDLQAPSPLPQIMVMLELLEVISTTLPP
jgi:hypothetical protein